MITVAYNFTCDTHCEGRTSAENKKVLRNRALNSLQLDDLAMSFLTSLHSGSYQVLRENAESRDSIDKTVLSDENQPV